jgi:hypothetical protein
MARTKLFLSVLLILTLQNLILFFRHYFQGYGIPWDFCQTYHAFPYYWIELTKLGIDASWVPFAGMGYPLFMNLQSGFFYPFFWGFVIFNQPYTFHAAVVMQGIHVLFAGIGGAVCARLLGLSWRHALFAGVLYQGFGGFYSNAEHPDIVRSFAFIPWMLSPVFADWTKLQQSRLLKISIATLPFIIYCQWTGGYPGITIASLFILGIIVFTRLLFGDDRKTGSMILVSCIAGTLLASVFLLPVAMQMSEIARASGTQSISYDYLLPGDVFALLYRVNNPSFAHDISMRSLFVGIPVIALVLIGITNLYWRSWNKWIIFSGVLALLMSTGLLHSQVIKLFPPLGFSRFTMAEYRAFIALALILLAAGTLQSIEKTQRKDNYVWALVLLLFLWIGNQFLGINKLGRFREGMLLFAVLVATIVVLGPLRSKKALWVLPALIIISLFDWGRVHGVAHYFAMIKGQAYCETQSNRVANKKLLDKRLTTSTGECRAARVNIEGEDFAHFSWRGYYSGEYMMQDYAGSIQFKRQKKILADTSLTEFAASPWRMVSVPDKTQINAIDFRNVMPVIAHCVSYGTTEISHTVDMATPGLIVENEIYWLGWQAELINLNNQEHEIIKPLDVNGFRGWHLPAGKYDMIEKYTPPYRKLSVSVTFSGFLVWLGVLFILWKDKIPFNLKRLRSDSKNH